MTKPTENQSATVPRAQQAEEILSRWRWVKPCAWTVRMLTTLEQGVKGGKWFRLFDKVFAERNLWAAFQQVAQNDGAPGVDHADGAGVREDGSRTRSGNSRTPLKAGRYHTAGRFDGFTIPKPGSTETRPLGIPTVRDRVVQAAIVNVIEPIFERDFAEHSYGFRPGRGCKDALRRVDQLLKAGYVHVVDADLKGYFDSIPHDRLMARLEAEDRRRPRAAVDRKLPEGGHSGGGDAMDADGRRAARGGAQSAAEQHLSRSAGPPAGRSGLRDGAIRRRLRHPVPHGGRRRAGIGTGPAMGEPTTA